MVKRKEEHSWINVTRIVKEVLVKVNRISDYYN